MEVEDAADLERRGGGEGGDGDLEPRALVGLQ